MRILIVRSKRKKDLAQEIAIHGDKLNVCDSWARAQQKSRKKINSKDEKKN